MLNITFVIGILSAGTLTLSIAMLITLVAYLRNAQILGTYKDKEEQKASQIEQETSKILDQARQQAFETIKKTNQRASSIIQETEFFTQDSKNSIQSEIEKTFKGILDRTTAESITLVENVSKHIENAANLQIQEFLKTATDRTSRAQEQTDQTIKAELAKAKKEIEAYKVAQLQKIDSATKEAVEKATQDILGQALTLGQHEELIMHALEQAKKDIVKAA